MSTNRLSTQTSPYLLQHKDNPVAWWPWGPDALAEAKRSDKPILLSIGYAACHWCHVMAHECFEDDAIAEIMNRLFVNIKVDREERPDLDAIYLSALALLGQAGGWPLTMFLTPDGEPFWGGTYFPPTPRYGRSGFPQVLEGIASAYAKDHDKVVLNVESLRDGMHRMAAGAPGSAPTLAMMDESCRAILDIIDPAHGGIMGAPKFPQPALFGFLWRGALRNGDEALRQAVTLTLDHLCQGGIYDHVGGGFHRYSTDETWLVPHFEKMLYDNAQLIELLTLVWQDTRSGLYRRRVEETIGWLLREMIAEQGAFASSIDADSEGEEGLFYVWSESEIDELIPEKDRYWVKQAFDVSAKGNWAEGKSGNGGTILHRNHVPIAVGKDFEDMLAEYRQTLLEARDRRVRPERDDKILADWNGMMIAALANAAFVFDRADWHDAARTAFTAIQTHLNKADRLHHSYRLGRAQGLGLIDDYAHMARAAVILYETTGDPDYLAQAETWVASADRHHWDTEKGGYFLSADDARDVIHRTKPISDSALPSGNGMMAQLLAKLHCFTGNIHYRDRAEAIVTAFSGALDQNFVSMTSLMAAQESLQSCVQIVIRGNRDEAHDLLRVVAETALPDRALSGLSENALLSPGHPAQHKMMHEGKPTAYVCRGQTCSAPITAPEALRATLLEG